MAFLEVKDVHTYYGQSHVLHGMTLDVHANEVVSLLGRNGAGKTTTIHSIMGMTPPRDGRILFDGNPINQKPPYEIFKHGIRIVPQGRRIIPVLTVEENLRLAALHAVNKNIKREIERVYEPFPILLERRNQRAGHLSGGERQMLAIARALLGKPRLILMDEPSEGLAPIIIREIAENISRIKQTGVSILLAEQNVKMALKAADRHYIVDEGVVKFTGTTAELEHSETIEEYLGVSMEVAR